MENGDSAGCVSLCLIKYIFELHYLINRLYTLAQLGAIFNKEKICGPTLHIIKETEMRSHS